MKNIRYTLLIYILINSLPSIGQNLDYLQECWAKQVKPLTNDYLKFYYHENQNELVFDKELWAYNKNSMTGMVMVKNNDFIKSDTINKNNINYFSKVQCDNETVIFIDYGDFRFSGATIKDLNERLVNSARYTPIRILNSLYARMLKLDFETMDKYIVYKLIIGECILKIWVNKTTYLVDKIVTVTTDDFLGDITTGYAYNNYQVLNGLYYPTNITINKYDDKIKDEVSILHASLASEPVEVIHKPEGYTLNNIQPFIPDMVIEQYNSHISIVRMNHANMKSMIVEFKDFFMIIDAPFNPKNGSLIMVEAKRKAKDKAIKYFSFGHRMPNFLGGLRAFIYEEAKILCAKTNIEYVKYLSTNSRKVKPDILQLEPKEIQLEEIKGSRTISDGEYEVKIYNIGNKMDHNNDYLIYYFPAEKLIFEDDMVFIKNGQQSPKVAKKQSILYNAIKDLGLTVETIIQSFPSRDDEYKTKFSFKELEDAVNVGK